MKLITILIFALLTGCGTLSVSSSTPTTVIVKAGPGAPRTDIDAALAMAEKECAKHNRHAHVQSTPAPYQNYFVFGCS